jgi:hypothetical protein
MSLLSNVLTQVNDRKELITINNEQLTSIIKSSNTFAYFSTVENLNHVYLSDSNVDSLKITKIEHHFSLISRDLFDKFRVVKFDYTNLKNYFSFNLITSGIENSDEMANNLLKLYYVYKNILNVKTKFNSNSFICYSFNSIIFINDDFFKDHNEYLIDSCLFKLIIKEISGLVHNKKAKDEKRLDARNSNLMIT